MFTFLLGGIPLPITPSKLEKKTKGANKTVTLVNEGEVNVLKTPKLEEISFDAIIPFSSSNPLLDGSGTFHNQAYYEKKFKNMMSKKKPVEFSAIYFFPGKKTPSYSKMMVTIEELDIELSSENGIDQKFSFTLKAYKEYGVKNVTVSSSNKTKKKSTTATKSKKISGSFYVEYKVQKGDTLALIAKKYLGSTKSTYQKHIYTENKSVIETAAKKNGKKSSANGKYLYKGTKLTITGV